MSDGYTFSDLTSIDMERSKHDPRPVEILPAWVRATLRTDVDHVVCDLSASHVCVQPSVLLGLLLFQARDPLDYEKAKTQEVCHGCHNHLVRHLHCRMDLVRDFLRLPDADAAQTVVQDCRVGPNKHYVVYCDIVRNQRDTSQTFLRLGTSSLKAEANSQLSIHVFGPIAGLISDPVSTDAPCMAHAIQDNSDRSGGP